VSTRSWIEETDYKHFRNFASGGTAFVTTTVLGCDRAFKNREALSLARRAK